jgi:Glycosyltransferase family 87
MSTVTSMMLILGGCTAVTVVATLRRWSPALVVSVGVAVGLRMLVAIVALGHTPVDVKANFHSVASFAAHGKDPLVAALPYQWNFLPAMPYLWSALLHLHLPWETTDKIPVIVAEGLNTVLVATLALSKKRLRAFQYAVSPLALLVAGWHGQIDPIALSCCLLALVCLRRRAYWAASALVGLGIVIKTWPAVFALAVLRGTRPVRWPAVLAAMVALPVTFFVTSSLFLRAQLGDDARLILGYRSFVGTWGWSGVVRIVTHREIVGYTGSLQVREQRIGEGLFVLALLAILWLWQRAEPGVFMLAILLAFLATTAGFGVQYLCWPLPLAIAYGTGRTWLYIWPASAFAAFTYLGHQSVHQHVALSVVAVVGIVLALPVDQMIAPRRTADLPAQPPPPQPRPRPAWPARPTWPATAR